MKERQIILRLVAEGKISPEEAEALLAALDDDAPGDECIGDEGAEPGTTGPENTDSSKNERRRTYTYTSTSASGRKGTTTASKLDFSDLEEQMAELGRAVPEVTAAALKGLAKGIGRVRKAATHVKYGIHIDKHRVTGTRDLSFIVQPGDFLIIDIPIGNISVTFADVPQLHVQARLGVWGSSDDDARARLAALKITANRQETAVVIGHSVPEIKGVGVIWTRDPSVDYDLTVPHGVHLRLDTRAGDITVTGRPRGRWELDTRLGDIGLTIEPGSDLALLAETSLGAVRVDIDGKKADDVRQYRATFGTGQATVQARTRLGDISAVTVTE